MRFGRDGRVFRWVAEIDSATPGIATWKRLQQAGAASYRTNRNGAIRFYLDGRSVTPQLACLR